MEQLPHEARRLGIPQEVADRVADELRAHAEELIGDSDETAHRHAHRLHNALLAVKRNTLVVLRDTHRIDDAVLRRVQATLDAEEVRLDLREAAVRVRAGGRSGDDDADAPEGDGPDRREDDGGRSG